VFCIGASLFITTLIWTTIQIRKWTRELETRLGRTKRKIDALRTLSLHRLMLPRSTKAMMEPSQIQPSNAPIEIDSDNVVWLVNPPSITPGH
jgi:hypothetical protein